MTIKATVFKTNDGWYEVSIGDILIGSFPTEVMANQFARMVNSGIYDEFLPPGTSGLG